MTALEQWALGYLERLSDNGRCGVLMGGSIARGQHWAHSDLEAGLLVNSFDASVPYFNVDRDFSRGVEIIQLVAPDLSKQVDEVESGNLNAVSTWPIQLYKARIISDPTSLLKRFTTQFDRHLFSPLVTKQKFKRHAHSTAQALERASTLVAASRARAALCEIRFAMNETVLALHWSIGELPRSQNRVDSRLRDLTARHGLSDFYALFRDVFDLENTDEVVARDWPVVKEQILELASPWNAREFFEIAVDGTFSWGENHSILAAYRLYMPLMGPLMGHPEVGIYESIDDPDWTNANPGILRFLGLENTNAEIVSEFSARIRRALTPPSM